MEKEEEVRTISSLHPSPQQKSDVFKVKKRKYGIKENGNKTRAYFPLPLYL